jgi:hypothetical protein
MNNIPTAEKFLLDFELGDTGKVDIEDAKEALVEFTKLHVQAALKAATESAQLIETTHSEYQGSMGDENGLLFVDRTSFHVDEESILNSYPSSLIQ